MLEVYKSKKCSYKIIISLEISGNISDVTFCHSTIAEGESMKPILTNYCWNPVN